jgi:hypothetical protein
MIFKPTRLTPALLGLLAATASLSRAYALDPGYIEAVKADAEEFTTHEFHAPADSTWLGDTDNRSAQLADLQGFSEYIRSKSPGTYIFYQQLTDEYRSKLHQDYLSTGDLDRVKQDIFKYMREIKQQPQTNQHSR